MKAVRRYNYIRLGEISIFENITYFKNTRMNIFNKLVLIALVFCLVSCSSDSEDNPSSQVLLKNLQAKVLGNNNEYNFTYSGEKLNKISFSFFDGSIEQGYYQFQYSGNLITTISKFSVANVLLFETSFTYNADNLTQVLKKNSVSLTAEKIIFTYNSDASVSAQTYIGDFTNQTQLTETENLTFVTNKLTQKTFVSQTNPTFLNNTTTFGYDEAFHPLNNVIGMANIKEYVNLRSSIFSASGLEGIKNNRISESSQFVNGDTTLINFETEYNSKNYPISKNSTINSSGNYEYQYSYY